VAEPAHIGSSRIVVPLSGQPADISELVMADHLDQEEQGLLADGLADLTMAKRRKLGRQSRAFVAAWRLDAASRG
jgi:hypothetical protein